MKILSTRRRLQAGDGNDSGNIISEYCAADEQSHDNANGPVATATSQSSSNTACSEANRSSAPATEPTVTRSGRTSRPPARFGRDYGVETWSKRK